MYSIKILLSKVALALVVALSIIGTAHLMPQSAQNAIYSAAGVLIVAIGSAVANDLQTFKTSKKSASQEK